jgi:hypothetical protein
VADETVRPLGVELRFRPLDAERLRKTLDALLRWEPGLAPGSVDRLSDVDAEGPEPWRDELWALLAERCASGERVGWSLFSADGRAAVNVGCGPKEVTMSVTVPRGSGDPEERFRALVESTAPALGMVVERDTPDDELILQGLDGLESLPQLLYVDRDAAERFGGLEHVRNGPSPSEGLGEGVLLRIPESAREEVRRHLGIGT